MQKLLHSGCHLLIIVMNSHLSLEDANDLKMTFSKMKEVEAKEFKLFESKVGQINIGIIERV